MRFWACLKLSNCYLLDLLLLYWIWPWNPQFWSFLTLPDCWGSCKLVTVVKGDPKILFSIATTPKCREGCHSFPWVAPLYPWSIPYDAEWESLVWLNQRLNPSLPGPLANTLVTQAKFLEPSGYSIMINCTFIFCTFLGIASATV